MKREMEEMTCLFATLGHDVRLKDAGSAKLMFKVTDTLFSLP